jgi:uncharacterized C2H2 Zn-finger protein
VDAGEGNEPEGGRIEGPALTFLQRRGVISLELQMRFMKQQSKACDGELFFACPKKGCGAYLLDQDPEDTMIVVKGKDGHMRRRAKRPGECSQCHSLICVVCHALLESEEAWKKHDCGFDRADATDPATQKLLAKNGKKCPNCGMLVLKRGGCNTMMCGGDSHGSIVKAIQNGGCGHQFNWSNLQPANTYYIGIDGKKRSGTISASYRLKAIAAAMKKDGYDNSTGPVEAAAKAAKVPLWRSAAGVRYVMEGNQEGCSCLAGRCMNFDQHLARRGHFTKLPTQLEGRLEQGVWVEWMQRLLRVQKTCSGCCLFRFIQLLTLLHASPLHCIACWSHCDRFQIKMRRWLRDFNREELEPRGMYAKGFCFSQMSNGGYQWDEGSLAFVAFALTHPEIARLKREKILQHPPWNHDPNWGCWCLFCHKGRVI